MCGDILEISERTLKKEVWGRHEVSGTEQVLLVLGTGVGPRTSGAQSQTSLASAAYCFISWIQPSYCNIKDRPVVSISRNRSAELPWKFSGGR
jgi:hypothetical protein